MLSLGVAIVWGYPIGALADEGTVPEEGSGRESSCRIGKERLPVVEWGSGVLSAECSI